MPSPPEDGDGIGPDGASNNNSSSSSSNGSKNISNNNNSNSNCSSAVEGCNNMTSSNSTLFASCRFRVSPAAAEECPALAGQIETYGGRLDNYLTDMSTHVVVLDYDRDSDLIQEATDLYEKPVITSRWVILSIAANRLLPMEGFNPQRRLFHDKVFCISSLARNDVHALWGMISYHGGRVQLRLDNKCTHLLTTRMNGAKYARASNSPWITIVTPDWVVECVTQRELRSPEPYHPSLLIKTSPVTDTSPSPKFSTTPPQLSATINAVMPLEVKPEPATTPIPQHSPSPCAGQMMNSTPPSGPQLHPVVQQASPAGTAHQGQVGSDMSSQPQHQPCNSTTNQIQYSPQIQPNASQQQVQQMQLAGKQQQQQQQAQQLQQQQQQQQQCPGQLQQANNICPTSSINVGPQPTGPTGAHVQQMQTGGQISPMVAPSPQGPIQGGQQSNTGPLPVSQGQSMQTGLQAIATSGQGQPAGPMGRVMQSGQVSPGGMGIGNMHGGQAVGQGNMSGQLAQMLTGGQRMASSPNGPVQIGVQVQSPQAGQLSSGPGQAGAQMVMINQGGKMVPMTQQQQQQQQPGSLVPQQAQRMMFQQANSGGPQQMANQQIGMQPPQQQQQQQQAASGVGMSPTGQAPQMVRMQQWVTGPQGQPLSPQQIQMIRQQRHRMVIAGGPPGSNSQRLVMATPEQLQQIRLRQPGPGGPNHVQQQQQMLPPANQQMVQQQSGGQIVTTSQGMVQPQQQQVMSGAAIGTPGQGGSGQMVQGGQWRFPSGPPGGPGNVMGVSWGQQGGQGVPAQQGTPPLSPVQQQPPQDPLMQQQQRHLQQQHDQFFSAIMMISCEISAHFQQRMEMQRRHMQMQQQPQQAGGAGGVTVSSPSGELVGQQGQPSLTAPSAPATPTGQTHPSGGQNSIPSSPAQSPSPVVQQAPPTSTPTAQIPIPSPTTPSPTIPTANQLSPAPALQLQGLSSTAVVQHAQQQQSPVGTASVSVVGLGGQVPSAAATGQLLQQQTQQAQPQLQQQQQQVPQVGQIQSPQTTSQPQVSSQSKSNTAE
ncbi:PAX-interacting protein 1-like [Tropilaelaps mercedesae]|uniref:PAX-interacting protein 1-like n=1 Tax=Tropilaelaps mercedesae TaxID=418985 RepID=A0A1V9X021_9ACAR|nr:PAX-interacting protein 1-like [Tropilaelaps mercedesae]